MRKITQITALLLAVLAGWQAGPAFAQGLLGQEPKILDMTRGSWAYFRDYNGRQLIYFTHLEAYKCGIAAVSYSLNSDALDKSWKLQPCDLKKPHNVTTDKPYISLPLGTAKSITVHLTFNDGAKSKVVRIGSDNQIIR
jgi:hypothetical protein